MARGMLYIFQKSWIKGILHDAFKLDPKVMLPTPGKTDYNVTKSYNHFGISNRKNYGGLISNRLIWKFKVDRGIADTQFAYRKHKSCVQTMLRVCNSISKVRSRKEYTAVRKLLRENMEG